MNKENKEIKYFIYARKSSESEDRQINSIEDQLDLLKERAKRDGLHVVDILQESGSAKKPGRKVFNEMMERINKGEADGILCWKLNRLARNPVDGGNISWALQNSIIKRISTFSGEYKPSDNVLMMAVELGMSNQFVIDLRKDSLRGTLKKARQGWMPSRAPLGYINVGRIQGEKTIEPDEKRFLLTRKMWDMVLEGKRVSDITRIVMDKWGMKNRKFKNSGDSIVSKTQIYIMFSNIFYTGNFMYRGKMYKGKHKPMVTMEEFQKVQGLLNRDNKPRPSKYIFAYTGVIRCGCGCGNAITAYQKKGRYVYYTSTKKRKVKKCTQQQLPEIELKKQILAKLDQVSMDQDFLDLGFMVIDRLAEHSKKEKYKMDEMKESSIEDKKKEMLNLKHMRMKDFIDDDEFIKSKKRLEREIIVLEEKETTDKGINEKRDRLKDRLQLMSEAKRKLENTDDPDKSREILALFGYQHVLMDKKFDLRVTEWFKPVLSDYKKAMEEAERLELDLSQLKQRKNEDLTLVFPTLGRMIKEVRKRY